MRWALRPIGVRALRLGRPCGHGDRSDAAGVPSGQTLRGWGGCVTL